MGAPHRQIARRIAQAVLLLVGRVVLLVHHDQAQLAQRREHRHARAQQHARLAALGAGPGLQAFAIGQAAMHHRQAIRPDQRLQTRAQRAFQLRRQIDFGHHQQYLASCRQDLLGRPQVDLGLAAARHTVQQHGLEPVQRAYGVHRLALGVIEFRRLIGLGRRARSLALASVQPRHRSAGRALALIGRGLAQRRRQGRQHHLAQWPLIVVRSKPGQAQPVLIERRQVVQHLFDRPDLLRVEGRFGRVFHHHTDQLAAAERHDDPQADRHRRLAAVVERAGQGHVQRHAHPADRGGRIWLRFRHGG